MTNHITPTAKTLLTAALAASALLGLSACGSSTAKPSAAAAGTPTANQSQQAPAPNAATTTATATTQAPDVAQASTQAQGQPQNQNQTQTNTPTTPTTKKPSAPKGSTPKSPKPSTTDSGIAAACTPDHLKGTVSNLARPINHVLLTVTNTGGAACSVYYYPGLRFDADQQAVTQAVEDSKPQAVVTIDPGQSAYASIGTSAADSSAGKVEPQVEVFLEARDQSGSLPGSLKLPLPYDTVVDQNSAFVTYWQYDMQSAIAW
ncbi:hypothetical protein ABH935_004703 [Catenulispora sp. GAS73]|uniref:DUF4232 domain-containing protein n=1 Tax=Catenulispora sp. GAS73 TaxID=3156269 RepID=UPI0035115A58